MPAKGSMAGGLPYGRISQYYNSPQSPTTKTSSLKQWSMQTPSPEHGFGRSEMYSRSLVGTVKHYERHVFLGWADPESWPSKMESASRMPKYLADAIKARKQDLHMETKLTIFEAKDGSEFGNGDIMVFPDMICIRQLTRHDVDTFVEEVLVQNQLSRLEPFALPLSGSHVFVCCHGTRDPRCGACGPVLVTQFKEDVETRDMVSHVRVHSCSHIGGHKYAGNVIVFSTFHGVVTGDWYGYVTPNDVGNLLESHIRRGEVVEHLWRGRMGLTEEEQKAAHESFPSQRAACGDGGTCEQCVFRQDMSSSLTEASSPDDDPSPSMDDCSTSGSSCRMAPAPPKKPRIVLKAPGRGESSAEDGMLRRAGKGRESALERQTESKAGGQWTAAGLADRFWSWTLPHWEDDKMPVAIAIVAVSVGLSVTAAWQALRVIQRH